MNYYLDIHTLGLKYDYDAVGEDYRKEILSTTMTTSTRMGNIEVN